MKYPPPFEARCLFIDGPVAIYIHEAPLSEIMNAYDRLGKLVALAAGQFGIPEPNPDPVPAKWPFPGPADARRGSTGGEGG